MGLAELLSARAREDYEAEVGEPSTLAAFLSELCQLSPAQAEALVWAEEVELDAEALERISSAFALHRDLLGCFLCPTSDEVIEHVLVRIAENELDYGCPICDELVEQIAYYERLDEHTRTGLCLAVLAHVNSVTETLAPTHADPPAGMPSDLLRVFSSLDPAAQARVLAYAYSELGGAVNDPRPQRNSAYGHLRQRYLTPLARRVFDALAASDEGELSSADLVRELDLAHARALGQLPRSVQRSLSELSRDGHRLEEAPFTVRRRGGERVYRLSSQALESWRALLAAENGQLLGG
jgi:hypothetical protein